MPYNDQTRKAFSPNSTTQISEKRTYLGFVRSEPKVGKALHVTRLTPSCLTDNVSYDNYDTSTVISITSIGSHAWQVETLNSIYIVMLR